MAGWNIPDAMSRGPFGPDPAFNAANPVTSPIGEEQRAPTFGTTPGGGGRTQRRLVVKQSQVMDWIVFFTSVQSQDPYTMNNSLWELQVEPFEKQLRISTTAIESLFPGLAYFELAVLSLVYESTGMRWYPGMGLVKEEQKTMHWEVPVGTMRAYGSATVGKNLTWPDADPDVPAEKAIVYFGEHPHCIVEGREILVTFPFAPSGAEPFGEGVVNSDAFTLPVTGDTPPPSTLKYMGVNKEASVVIPAVGIYTGLIRYRKSFCFHYLNATMGPNGQRLTWNIYWRGRDQQVKQMLDISGNPYLQHTPVSFNGANWWL